MKYLSDYTEQPYKDLLKNCNAFYAFDTATFKKKRKLGRKYLRLSSGLIVDARFIKEFNSQLDIIYQNAILADTKENGIDKIILRELENHECFYTGNYYECEPVLKPYGVTLENIKKTYYENSKFYKYE